MNLIKKLFQNKSKKASVEEMIDVEYIKENPHKFLTVESVFRMFLDTKGITQTTKMKQHVKDYLDMNGYSIDKIRKSIIKGFIAAEAYDIQFEKKFAQDVANNMLSSLDITVDKDVVEKDVIETVKKTKATNINQTESISLRNPNGFNFSEEDLKDPFVLFDYKKLLSKMPNKYRNISYIVLYKILEKSGFNIRKYKFEWLEKTLNVSKDSTLIEFKSAWHDFLKSDEFSELKSSDRVFKSINNSVNSYKKLLKNTFAPNKKSAISLIHNIIFDSDAVSEKLGVARKNISDSVMRKYGFSLSEYRMFYLEKKLGINELIDAKGFEFRFNEFIENNNFSKSEKAAINYSKNKLAEKYSIY